MFNIPTNDNVFASLPDLVDNVTNIDTCVNNDEPYENGVNIKNSKILNHTLYPVTGDQVLTNCMRIDATEVISNKQVNAIWT